MSLLGADWKLTKSGRIPASKGNKMTETVDEAIAKIPDGWMLTLDRYILSSEPHESEHTWRAWLRRLAGDVEGDGPCYLLKAFGVGRTPALAIQAARFDAQRFINEHYAEDGETL